MNADRIKNNSATEITETKAPDTSMNAGEIGEHVRSQIGNAWEVTNAHGVDLREALVPPAPITVIERLVRNGKTHDRVVDAWLVLIENPKAGTGYRIVATMNGSMFGLASEGFPSDRHLVLYGWHGDFLATFRGM